MKSLSALLLFVVSSPLFASDCSRCQQVYEYCEQQIPIMLMEVYESDDAACFAKAQVYIDIRNMITPPQWSE